MKYIIPLLSLLLLSCAQTRKTPEILHPSLVDAKAQRINYWLITGAENILRNSNQATLAVWIKPEKNSHYPQDVVSVAVGGDHPLQTSSRAAIRLDKGGKLYEIGRALDSEGAQHIITDPVLVYSRWQHIALVIDYEKNFMQFYHDGKPVPSKGRIRFKGRKTSDTPSRYVAVGSEDDGLSRHFEGQLKHAGIWNKILSQEEIKVLIEEFTNQMISTGKF